MTEAVVKLKICHGGGEGREKMEQGYRKEVRLQRISQNDNVRGPGTGPGAKADGFKVTTIS